MVLATDPLLQNILDNPDDDLVRLVYADWLEEQGQGDRAEFIRVQVELANRLAGPAGPVSLESLWVQGDKKIRDLLWRERQLLNANVFLWLGKMGDLFPIGETVVYSTNPPTRYHGGWSDGDMDINANFRCGFIEEITCPWKSWRDHARIILACQPVQQVRLTSWPDVEVFHSHRSISTAGTSVLVALRGERTYLGEPDSYVTPLRGIDISDLLSKNWLGISFHLPPLIQPWQMHTIREPVP